MTDPDGQDPDDDDVDGRRISTCRRHSPITSGFLVNDIYRHETRTCSFALIMETSTRRSFPLGRIHPENDTMIVISMMPCISSTRTVVWRANKVRDRSSHSRSYFITIGSVSIGCNVRRHMLNRHDFNEHR